MLGITMALTAISLVVSHWHEALAERGWQNLFLLFCLDKEANIPTWYQSSTLLLCALRMRYIAWVKDGQGEPDVCHWKVLSILFAFLSLDELVSIHELAVLSLRHWLGTGGLLHQSWVLPGVMFVALIGWTYARFVFRQPGKVRWLLILSAVLYVGGAIGFEMLGGYYLDRHDPLGRSVTYHLLMTCEEFLEMMGVVVLMYTLLLPDIMSWSRPSPSSDVLA